MGINEHASKPNRLLAKLKMKRNANPTHTYVLVEGKTDQAVWARFKADHCELMRADGKDKVIATLQLANRKYPSWGNVAAIVDPDVWLIEESDELHIANLLYDDIPDLDLMLIKSPALKTVVRNTITVDRADEYTERLRKEALRLGKEIGYFRLFQYRNREYNLNFGSIVFEDVIDKRTFELDVDSVAELLVRNSAITRMQLLERIEILRNKYSADVRLCRGHDVRAIIACLIKFDDNLSEKVKIQTKSGELSRTLRMAYEFTYFITTQLYSRIRKWESENTPFRIVQDFPLERTAP